MKRIQIFLLLFAIIFVSNNAFAQPDLPSEEVEVIQDFEARLAESEKLDLLPQLPPMEDESKELIYQIPVKTLQLEYLPPKLRPLAMPSKKQGRGRIQRVPQSGIWRSQCRSGQFFVSLYRPGAIHLWCPAQSPFGKL